MTIAPAPKPPVRAPKARKPIPRVRANPRRAKKRPQATRTALRRKADGLFSLYIRARDKVCQRCGKADLLQCAHVHSRRYLAIRYDPLNAMCLCARCHKWQTEFVLEGQDFMIEQLGVEPYAELRRLALKGGLPDYVTVITDLTERIATLAEAA